VTGAGLGDAALLNSGVGRAAVGDADFAEGVALFAGALPPPGAGAETRIGGLKLCAGLVGSGVAFGFAAALNCGRTGGVGLLEAAIKCFQPLSLKVR
jgi:hypothetical protein